MSVAKRRTTALRCLGGSPLTAVQSSGSPPPTAVSGRLLELGFSACDLLRAPGRNGAAPARAVVVDRLAVRDREQPGAQVAGVLKLGVGAQRRDERLLEDSPRHRMADGGHQEAEHVGAVLVQQRLEGRKGLIWHRPLKRRTRGVS